MTRGSGLVIRAAFVACTAAGILALAGTAAHADEPNPTSPTETVQGVASSAGSAAAPVDGAGATVTDTVPTVTETVATVTDTVPTLTETVATVTETVGSTLDRATPVVLGWTSNVGRPDAARPRARRAASGEASVVAPLAHLRSAPARPPLLGWPAGPVGGEFVWSLHRAPVAPAGPTSPFRPSGPGLPIDGGGAGIALLLLGLVLLRAWTAPPLGWRPHAPPATPFHGVAVALAVERPG